MIHSRKQRMIVILAACALVAAMLFPPWLLTYDENGSEGGHSVKPFGYRLLFWQPSPYSGRFSGLRIDTTRLLLECACIAVVSGVALWFTTATLPNPRSLDRQDKPPSGKMENVTPPATLTGKPLENSAGKLRPIEWAMVVTFIVVFVVIFVVWVWGR